MTKTFNFNTKNNSNTFLNKNYTNYSKILDDIIIDNIIDKNKYLFNYKKSDDIFIDDLISDEPIILISSKLKASDDFTKATNFLANYKKYKKTYKIPYILGKMYTLSNGTPIIFYDDEIQIGFDTYTYSNFSDLAFLNNLTTNTKKIIIDIYTTGGIDININLH